jgi:hypothetical protein
LILGAVIGVVSGFYRDCEKGDNQNRDPPSADDVNEHKRKSQKHIRLVKDIEKRVVKHDKTKDEKNHPGLL